MNTFSSLNLKHQSQISTMTRFLLELLKQFSGGNESWSINDAPLKAIP